MQQFLSAGFEQVFYATDLDCFVVLEQDGDTLFLQSVVCKKKTAMKKILKRIIMKKEEKVLFWSERVQEFYSSGQTCRTWCQEHQVPVSTMSYWIRKLKNVDPVSVKEDAPVFAKLPTEQELRRKEPVSLQLSSSVHIFLNESIRIEIQPSCPAELLSAIIKALRYHA